VGIRERGLGREGNNIYEGGRHKLYTIQSVTSREGGGGDEEGGKRRLESADEGRGINNMEGET